MVKRSACPVRWGETIETGHWHGDMPGLTEDVVVLATSPGCPCQIIRFSSKHYAFQAHLEFDPEAVDLLIAADGEDLEEQSQKLTFVQNLKPFVLTIIEK